MLREGRTDEALLPGELRVGTINRKKLSVLTKNGGGIPPIIPGLGAAVEMMQYRFGHLLKTTLTGTVNKWGDLSPPGIHSNYVMIHGPQEAGFLLGPTFEPDLLPVGSIGPGKDPNPFLGHGTLQLLARVEHKAPFFGRIREKKGSVLPSPPANVKLERI
jgi:hypothetical protein